MNHQASVFITSVIVLWVVNPLLVTFLLMKLDEHYMGEVESNEI